MAVLAQMLDRQTFVLYNVDVAFSKAPQNPKTKKTRAHGAIPDPAKSDHVTEDSMKKILSVLLVCLCVVFSTVLTACDETKPEPTQTPAGSVETPAGSEGTTPGSVEDQNKDGTENTETVTREVSSEDWNQPLYWSAPSR